jgi:hypothetical protein
MNIQDNAQRSSDYYKELKTVRKEIDKIYKLLTIDETFPEIINKIQNDLSKTITFILTNLSKPKSSYKELNTKIMKIIYLLIQTLKDFTYNNITPENIEEYLKQNPVNSNDSIDAITDILKKSSINPVKPPLANKIMKIILILSYYYELLENNTVTKENTDRINSIESRIVSETEPKKKEELIKLLEDTKTEADKGKYIDVLNYIQVTSFEIFEYVDSNYTKLKEKEKEKEKEVKSKSVEQNEANQFVDKFKKDIYYNFIANNSSGIDSESQLFENGNEKVELEARKDLLVKMKEQLDKQLNNLNGIIKFLIDSSKQDKISVRSRDHSDT